MPRHHGQEVRGQLLEVCDPSLERQGTDFSGSTGSRGRDKASRRESHLLLELCSSPTRSARRNARHCSASLVDWETIATRIGFSGDTISVWDLLYFQPYFTATAANVGYQEPWFGDIGGHQPGAIEPELYLRWIWCAGESSPDPADAYHEESDAERRIWANPSPTSTSCGKVSWRCNAMQPYIYTEARKPIDTGVDSTAIGYDWPEATEAYDVKNEYMFGDNIFTIRSQPVAKGFQLAHVTVWSSSPRLDRVGYWSSSAGPCNSGA